MAKRPIKKPVVKTRLVVKSPQVNQMTVFPEVDRIEIKVAANNQAATVSTWQGAELTEERNFVRPSKVDVNIPVGLWQHAVNQVGDIWIPLGGPQESKVTGGGSASTLIDIVLLDGRPGEAIRTRYTKVVSENNN